MSHSFRTVVVGAGAMGSLLAARLALSGADVALLGRRSAHLLRLQEGGLVLEDLDGSRQIVHLTATADPAGAAEADLVIVLVKAWATVEAIAPLRRHLRRDASLMTLQNGIGNAAAIRAALEDRGERDIIVGVTTQAALRVEPGRVRQTGVGGTVIGRESGRVDAQLREIAALLTAAGWRTETVEAIERWVWRKLAVNAAINPLTALAGVPNGAIVGDRDLREAAEALAREVASVAGARGLDLGDVTATVAEVASATAANRSSMLRDVESGGRTEIDAINGAVAREAARLGVEAPLNRLVTALIRARERVAKAKEGPG